MPDRTGATQIHIVSFLRRFPTAGRRFRPASPATIGRAHREDNPVTAVQFGGARIVYLQYLRATAALAVLLFHASYYLASMRSEVSPLKIFGARFGNFGVTLFFAISGYLMATLAERTAPTTFLVHRLIRIYPIYWIATTSCLALRYLFGDEVLFDPFAFLLIPGAQHFYPLAVEWTLPFELTFYLIVFFIILLRVQRLLPALAAAWMTGILAVHLIAPGLQRVYGQFPTLLYIPLAEKSLAFAAGLMVPFALRRRMIGPATPIVALALLMGSEAVPWLQPWLVDISCVLLVAAATLPRPARRGGEHDPGVVLGDWSFALYLCHVPIIICLYRFAPDASPPAALWFAGVATPLCGVVLLGRLDMALYVGLKRRIDCWRPLLRCAVAVVFIATMVGLGAEAELNQMDIRRVAAMGDAVGKHIQAAGAATRSAVEEAADAMGLKHSDGYVAM